MRVSCAHVYDRCRRITTSPSLPDHRGAPQSHGIKRVTRARSRVSFPIWFCAGEPAYSAGARVARVMRARFHAFWPWIRV